MELEIIENGVACGRRNRMGLVSEAVLKSAGAAREGFDDFRGDQDRAEGRVSTGNSFADKNHVRLDVPVLNGERLAGAAEAGHDFIGDEKHVVPAADFGDADGVTVGRGGGAKSCADDRLENKSGGRVRIVSGEKSFEIIGAS